MSLYGIFSHIFVGCDCRDLQPTGVESRKPRFGCRCFIRLYPTRPDPELASTMTEKLRHRKNLGFVLDFQRRVRRIALLNLKVKYRIKQRISRIGEFLAEEKNEFF